MHPKSYHPLLRPPWFLACAALLAALDQAAKALVRARIAPGDPVELVSGVIGFVHATNLRGVSWWVPEVSWWGALLVELALAVVLLGAYPLLRFHTDTHRASPWALGAALLLTGAAAGHLLDPVFTTGTTDWIRVLRLPAFNLADLYAYAGLVSLAVELWWVHTRAAGLTLRERIARARHSRREFVRYVRRGLRR